MTAPREGSATAVRIAPRVERRLLGALAAALVLHGSLLVSGTFRRTYDAYIHIFFADHYRRWWFDHWEPRWYTGFPITSYPPGSHQLTALLSRIGGLEAAFIVVQLTAILLLVIGVFRFSRLWVDGRAAGWAALLAVVSTSIAETIHVFGQLPTTLSLGFLLNATPSVHRYVREGRGRDLAAALAVTAATTAVHHVTTLFGAVFILGPVIVHAIVLRIGESLPDESPHHPVRVAWSTLVPMAARRLRRALRPVVRAGSYAALLVVVLVVVVLPYWLWSASDPITQLPIPHASRADFLSDRNAGLVFFVVPWGLTILALPVVLWRGFRSTGWPLAASIALLALLGTGGTTPLPRLILRGAFDILTLDRFTFWATVLVLPLVGELVAGWADSPLAHRLRTTVAGWFPTATAAALVTVALASTVATVDLTYLRPMQPDHIDVAPIVDFIDKDEHWRWRYLTLGFGDQMAWLAANTSAQTVDGNYHSARRLPELVTTPVERLEGAKFRGVPGIGSLQQFLTVPSRYHLKYVFSNDEFYDPLLHYSGWKRLERLRNGIVVWEREDVPPLPELLPRVEIPRYQRLMWGTLPMTAIAAAALVLIGMLWRYVRDLQPAPAPHVPWRRGPLAWLDRWLSARAHVPPAAGPLPLPRRSSAPRVTVSPRVLRIVATVLTGATVSAALPLLSRPTATPAEVVEAYHLALDVRDLGGAYAQLDPEDRPDYDGFLLQRSITDGLAAGYSTLDEVRASTTASDGAWARVEVQLTSITSLAELTRTEVHDLRWHDGRWVIRSVAPDLSIPTERFTTRAAVAYGQQGRRRITTGTTAYADVLDRPEIAVTSARLVEADGRLTVVGEIVNTDVRPADLTVTAQLLDADGVLLTSYDAGQTMLHELLPKASTGFRVDFEGVAGQLDPDDPAAGTFHPDAVTPFRLGPDDEVAAVHVYATAVVTGRELDRDLTVQDLRTTTSDDAITFDASLFDHATEAATIPRLIATLYDAEGVAWVEQVYAADGVRPGRDISVSLTAPAARHLRRVDVPVETFDNGLADRAWEGTPPRPHLDLDAAGYTGVRLDATAFRRVAS